MQYCATYSVSVSSSTSLRQRHRRLKHTKYDGVPSSTIRAAAAVESSRTAPKTVKLAANIKSAATAPAKVSGKRIVEGKLVERRRAFNSHLRKLNNNKKRNSLCFSLTINNIKQHCFGIVFGSSRYITSKHSIN